MVLRHPGGLPRRARRPRRRRIRRRRRQLHPIRRQVRAVELPSCLFRSRSCALTWWPPASRPRHCWGCYVVAVEIDPHKVELARHNARIYGLEDMIEFVVGDFFRLAPYLKGEDVHEAVWEGRIEVREDVLQGESDELAPAKKDAPEKMVNVEGVGEVDNNTLLDDAISGGPLVDPVLPGGALREVVEANVEEEGDLHVENADMRRLLSTRTTTYPVMLASTFKVLTWLIMRPNMEEDQDTKRSYNAKYGN
ncbi:uncharacterized protein LOC104581625 isoform X1 [Brachypodium distachyon]|uniref:Trimethylguanosine synthase n=1 Tax=Brachypodium distachyon TaxID=15368 RepID=A0A0Q3H8H0_BRADI|nr:uncharacterized protein LOC104581625 isoform X1 [Brachypodium distachyon]KQK19222.1 hypothetical protein BRADI_1g47035v3 [Brachypodium distachyon]KQK19223.1 hypothetical protein BRADI_1g47035v3 [Brachypodium distachyon]|eukprot:XP_014752387.1 uncharacterized protein LOC104581625 isoform X1 [Brachypodium distachyon]